VIRVPRYDIRTKFVQSPHVVILGAGASRACCMKGDRDGRKLPLMNDFIECLGIEDVIRKSGHDPLGNFEAIYSQIHRTGNSNILSELNSTIRDYFSKITIPDVPTMYDYLVLSMRSKDVIITFNWDPLLPQAYKRWRHLGTVLPQLLFLHGNVDIGIDIDKRAIGFLSDGPYPGHTLVPSKLLYPIDQKDYNGDPFVSESWGRTTDYLSDAYDVTIFGYSAPTTMLKPESCCLKRGRTTRLAN
jgi:hypothetical protein